MSDIAQINIVVKIDSPEKIAATVNIPENQKLMATEINAIVGKITELVSGVNAKFTAPEPLDGDSVMGQDADGNAIALPTFEFFKHDTSATSFDTVPELIAAGYENQPAGTYVYCTEMSPARVFVKYGAEENELGCNTFEKLPAE